MRFLVTDLGEDKIVLGFPWMAAFQLKIDWQKTVLHKDLQPVVIKTLGLKIEDEVAWIRKAWTECAECNVHHAR